MRHPAGIVVLLAIATLLPACRKQDEIRSYIVPQVAKTESSAQVNASTEPLADVSGEPTHRMLAAMVPAKEQAWFFKLTGSLQQIEQVAKAVDEFYASIRLDEAENKPTWDLPAGWTDTGASGMRLATIRIPSSDSEKPLELSVIGLPLVGEWSEQVLDNLNRWRGQMTLGPIASDQLPAETTQLEESSVGAVAVDMTGRFAAGGMTPPFARAAAPSQTMEAQQVEPQSPITFDLPKGWVKLPARPPRLINLRTDDSAASAEVTGMVFPAAGAMGDLLANVNRWRGQVGLVETDEQGISEQAEQIKVDGSDGNYVVLIGEKDGILAAMAERDGGIWFLKMMGPADVVQAEQENFRSWIASLKIRQL